MGQNVNSMTPQFTLPDKLWDDYFFIRWKRRTKGSQRLVWESMAP